MSLRNTLRIMVVDDMATSRGLITQALDEIGITNYVTENDGQKALEKLVASPVHIVLSDYNMPGMDGLGLLHAVRTTPAIQKTGFVLVTGRPTPELVTAAKKLGLNNLIKKPFDTQTMKKCLETLVGAL